MSDMALDQENQDQDEQLEENDPSSQSDPIMEDKEKSRRMASFWKGQIAQVESKYEDWWKKCDKILKRFRDERNRATEQGQRRLNVLWSNIQIMRPAIYGRVPQANVERRFLDKDPIGRVSAQMLERSLRNQLMENGFHSAMRQSVMDYLLVARGVAWVRYEPEIGEGLSLPVTNQTDLHDEMGDIEDDDEDDAESSPSSEFGDEVDEDESDVIDEKLRDTGEEIIEESVPVDHINYKDFLVFPEDARTWAEVQAIAKRVPLSHDQCVDRFGEEIADEMQADPSLSMTERMSQSNNSVFQEFNKKNRIVYEIWNKTDRKVYWVCTGYEYCCDVRMDPLRLRRFFPVVEPLFGTMTNDTLVPVPDYIEYQDQALQIDELTQRISMLSKACKVAGAYNAANYTLRRLLDESVENELIPVDQWAMFAERGGIKGSIDFLPLDQIVAAMDKLIAVRQMVLEDLDRITGLTDILRGTTDARETMGGTRLKSNNASGRLDDRRDDVARFARDLIQLVAEVTAKHFSAKALIESSGILYEDEMSLKPPVQVPAQPPGGSPAGLPAPGPQGAGPPQNAPASGAGPGNVLPFRPNQPGAPPTAPSRPGMPPGMPPGTPAGLPGAPGAPPPGPGQGPGQEEEPDIAATIARVTEVMTKIEKAIQLLRDDVPRGYRIDVETDTMVNADAAQERVDATAFIAAVTQFLETANVVVSAQPMAAPLMGNLLRFGVRKFRTGRDLESAIDDFVDRVEKAAKDGSLGQHGPSPEQIKQEIAQIGLQTAQLRSQSEIAKAKVDATAQEANDARAAQINQQEMQLKEREFQMRMQEMERQEQFKIAEHNRKMEDHDRQRTLSDVQHRQNLAQSNQKMLERSVGTGKVGGATHPPFNLTRHAAWRGSRQKKKA